VRDNLSGKELAGGRFRIIGEEPLGRGGFATVYLGIQTQLKRKVAIKVLSDLAAEDADLVERFIREAKIMAMFDHPNIIKIFDSGSEDGLHYFVMNYLPMSLQQVLRQPECSHGLPLNRWLKIAKDMSSALGYMHHHVTVKQFVHRDIKPANIMFDESGNAILTDFGLVKSGEFSQLTLKNTVMGTPKYMSPEQVRGEELDHRADIYSLGIVLYEMLIGQPPFSGDPLSICHQQVTAPAPSPRKFNQQIPESLEVIVLQCIAKNISERYQTAIALREALDEWENFTRKSPHTEDTLLSRTLVANQTDALPTELITHEPEPTVSLTSALPDRSSQKDRAPAAPATRQAPPISHISAALKWLGATILILAALLIFLLLNRQTDQVDAMGALRIESNPPGARVTIDGQVVAGTTPAEFRNLAPGKHRIQLELAHHRTWSDSIHMTRQNLLLLPTLLPADSVMTVPQQVLPAELEKGVVAPPMSGSIRITSTPAGAAIYLNDRRQSQTTNCILDDLTPGSYRLKLELEGYQSYETVHTVKVGQQATLTPRLEKTELAPPAATGRVSIVAIRDNGTPFWGPVYVNGKTIQDDQGEDRLSPCEIDLPSGTYTITVSKFGFEAREKIQTITLTAGEQKRLTFTMLELKK